MSHTKNTTRFSSQARFRRWAVIMCLCSIGAALLLTGCVTDMPSPSASPLSPVATPGSSAAPSGSTESLPSGAQLVGAEYTGDFDGDGRQEQVAAYQGPDGAGVIVNEVVQGGYQRQWQQEIPSGLTPVDFDLQDLTGEGLPELILFTKSDDGITQYMFVYMWRESTYVALTPVGGAWDGQEAFPSLYWQPMLDDIDFNSATEIVTFIENTNNPETLSAAVYEWNGSEFRHTTLFIISPRFKPTEDQ